MLISAVIIVVSLIVIYWYRRQLLSPGITKSLSFSMLVVLLSTLFIIVYVESMDRTYMRDDSPLLVVLAVDLSLSMGAIPDPRMHREIGTRMERAQKILKPLLNAFDASGAKVMMSVSGFTVETEMILGWDDNLPQVREVVDYVIAPGLLTEPGTDLGVALRGVVPLFNNLPKEYQEQESRKFLIVVSDGEQTVEKGDMVTALTALRAMNVNIIALHVGMLDIPEGLPVYSESGDFMGFQDIGGEIYTVPNTETMQLLAGNDTDKGLYVKGESSNAVGMIGDFIGVQMASTTSTNPLYLVAVLALWALSFIIMLWFV